MTCIVGLVDKGNVWLGGDAAGTAGYSRTIRTEPKVFQNGPMLIGYTSSFRMGQLLQYSLQVPKQSYDHSDYEYLITTFVDAVRDCLKYGGYTSISNNVESGGLFLVAYKGQLYSVESDFQIGTYADGFGSVGCGSDIALGSLYATKGKTPQSRLTTALEAAEHFSAGVAGPFTIINDKS